MSKKVYLIILAVTILSIISFTSIVGAEDLNELHDKRNELQEQITQSNEQIESLQIELTENLEQLNNLNLKISTYENDVALLEENLSKISLEIEEITSELNIIEESYNIQKDILQNRVVALYEAGEIIYLDVLLKSNSISEFISNYFLIGEIIEYDNEILEQKHLAYNTYRL